MYQEKVQILLDLENPTSLQILGMSHSQPAPQYQRKFIKKKTIEKSAKKGTYKEGKIWMAELNRTF